MNTLIDTVVFFVIISLTGVAIPARSEEQNLEAFYSRYVDRYIEKCQKKDKELKQSCMPEIKQYAALNCLRAAFVAFYKEGIVSSLMENKIGKKDYKIREHVNSLFLGVFKQAKGEVEKTEKLIIRAKELKDKQ